MSVQDFIDSLPDSDIKYSKNEIEKMYKDFIKNHKGGKKQAKKEKDPNAPKKTPNNYMNWCNAHREEYKGKNPNAKPTELTSILGAAWRELSDDEKAKWKSPLQTESSSSTTLSTSSSSASVEESKPVTSETKKGSRKSKK
jgi:hypothetical protein